MKVILIKDVARVGRIGEVKNLSDGYARNFIIARGLGLAATSENLVRLEQSKLKKSETEKLEQELLKRELEKLAAKPIIITARASETGHLFAAIHKAEILTELNKQAGLSLSDEAIILPQPIKSVGEHVITVARGSVRGKLKLLIQS